MISNHILTLISDIAVLFPVFLLVFTFRGFFQALIAKCFGDDTAQREGFLTGNPLAHVDIFGLSIILVVFFFLGSLVPGSYSRQYLFLLLIMFGIRWSIPVPFDDQNFKHYRLGGILTSLAGPFANFLLAFLGVVAIKILVFGGLSIPNNILFTIRDICVKLVDFAIWFALIDLIPVPPFDGGRALRYIFPPNKQSALDWLEEYSFYIFLILFFMPVVSDVFLGGMSFFSMVIKRIMFTLVLF
jgi:Zn-dependent protease